MPITDLHCHYPMHLVHDELEPHGTLLEWAREAAAQGLFDITAELFDRPGWGDRWCVDRAGLRAGGVGTVCSVLYWPADELVPGHGAHPKPGSFDHLLRQLDDVQAHLVADGEVIVHDAGDLDRGDLRFVHCVEGGFHLGPDPERAVEHVRTLADRGVFYITPAHLVPRGVAANAPAFPVLSDDLYHRIFHQRPGLGLTELGRAVVTAMTRHSVAVDISHMREDAIEQTFELLDELDPDGGMPVLASHVGVRSVAPGNLEYDITPQTMRAVRDRGGVIGLILSEHLMGESDDADRSRAILRDHVQAIHDELGTHAHTAIGTDLDGFVKPTLEGLQFAADLGRLADWLQRDFPADADAILHENADRVLRQVFERRGAVAP